MIFGDLRNFEQEGKALPAVLQTGLLFLKNTDLANLSIGRHDIDGDHIFALVSEYESAPKEQKQPESHQKYIDIQYVVRGEEVIGHSFLTSTYEVVQNELATRDLLFYKKADYEADMVLRPGVYGIFFPNDVHRPGCISSEPCSVKKIVIKIDISLL